MKNCFKQIKLIMFASVMTFALAGCGSSAGDGNTAVANDIDEQDTEVTAVGEKAEGTSFPDKYSLVEQGRVTAYKDQHQSGLCWAYATATVAESALITEGFEDSSIDLSEGHMVYCTYPYAEDRPDGSTEDGIYVVGDKKKVLLTPYYAGGSPTTAMQVFALGAGPVSETEAPFSTEATKMGDSVEAMMKLIDEGKLTKYMGKYLLTGTEIYSSNEEIKYGLMNRGAVAINLFMDSKGIGSDANGEANYYLTDMSTPPAGTNHVITIVGWDDNYSKDNFKNTPANDGAWLIKDSINASKKSDYPGYYWLSYDEFHGGDLSMIFAKREDYGTILSYDAVGPMDSIKSAGDKTVTANVFNADKDNEIKAVGVMTYNPKQKVRVIIYKNPEQGRPDSGERVYGKTYEIEYAGYEVIDLDEKIAVKQGDTFSVILQYTNIEGAPMAAPVEGDTKAMDLGSMAELYIVSNPGESFALQGDKWFDLSDGKAAKAFDKKGILNNAIMKVLMSN